MPPRQIRRHAALPILFTFSFFGCLRRSPAGQPDVTSPPNKFFEDVPHEKDALPLYLSEALIFITTLRAKIVLPPFFSDR